MGAYENGFLSIGAAAAAPYLTIHTGAALRVRIREIGLFTTAATASSIGLIRPANAPVATTSSLGQAVNPNDAASTVNVDTAWSTAPTIGTNVFLRRITVPAVIGNGVIWTWDLGAELELNVSSYVVLWNFGAAAGSILSGYVKWLE